MKKIIVPTDFSESALHALKIAADIASRQDNAEVHLVHMYERPLSGFTLQFEVDNKKLKQIRKHIHEKMNDLCSMPFLKNVKTVQHFMIDKEVWEFIQNPKLKDANLIIMGTHGIKGKNKLFIGSNTQKVVQLSSIPVLIIKDTFRKFELKNMVFASSFGLDANGSFAKIKEIASLFDSTIHLLRVNTVNDFEITSTTYSAMESFASKFKLKRYTMNVYNDESVESGIVHFNGLVKLDLIAMETHDRSRLQTLLNPGITRRVVNHTWKPVLSVKMKAEASGEEEEFKGKSKERSVRDFNNSKTNPVFV